MIKIRKPKMTPFKGLLIAILVLGLFPIAALATVTHDEDVIITGDLQVNGDVDIGGDLFVTEINPESYTLTLGDTDLGTRIKFFGKAGYINDYFLSFRETDTSYEPEFSTSSGSDRQLLFVNDGAGGFGINTDGPSDFGDDVNIAGNLTVDGTIYGELAENLVLEPPVGYSVAIAQGRALEANYVKALTGDEVTLDDDLTVLGDLVVSGSIEFGMTLDNGAMYFSGNTIADYVGGAEDIIINPQDDLLVQGDMAVTGDVTISSGNLYVDDVYAVGAGIEIAFHDAIVFPSGGTIEAEDFDLRLETAIDHNVVIDSPVLSFEGGWLADYWIKSNEGIDFRIPGGDDFEFWVDTGLELLIDSNSMDLANGSDFNIGSSLVMDQTGITDSSGSFTISTSAVAGDVILDGYDDAYVTSGDDVFLDGGSGGDVYVNLNGSTKLWIDDDGTYYGYLYGSAYANGNWVDGSDRRLKTNIVPVESLLDRIRQISVVRYNSIDGGRANIGIIAQDLDLIMKELVFCGDASEGGMCGISAYQLASVGVKGIQELYDLIQSLSIPNYDAQIAALESQVATLETQVTTLEAGMVKLEARIAALEDLLVVPEPATEG